MAQTTRHRSTTAAPGALRALQATAALTVLSIVVQGVTAGQLMSGNEAAESLHGGGALVLHVLSALTTAAAFLHWRATGGPVWPVALSAAVFVVSFLQAYVGSHGPMSVHVPLALILLTGAVWVLVWAVGPAVRRR